MKFQPDKPVYLQIASAFRAKIASGEYPPGARMPAVRDLAQEASVNPNTVQHAYTQLDAWGLTDARSTAGRFVTADIETIRAVRLFLAREAAQRYLDELQELGFDSDKAVSFLPAPISENAGK